ncbi:12801_t:CDS:1, partial [Gigaspora margarita]
TNCNNSNDYKYSECEKLCGKYYATSKLSRGKFRLGVYGII